MMHYHTYAGERYDIEKKEEHIFTLALVQPRTGKVKRTFSVKETEKDFVCNGRRCKKTQCRHVQMIYTLLERKPVEEVQPEVQEISKVINVNFTGVTHPEDLKPVQSKSPQEEMLIKLKDLIDELDFAATVAQREIEDKIEKTLVLARDQIRERTLSEYMHVLESNRRLIRERHLQCERCISHNACVRSDRQGFKCLTYFLCLDYANEMEWYQSIPLDNDVLCTVDFQSLLILSSIHCVNFDTMTDFSLEGLRDRLLEVDKSSQYLLTV